MKRRIAARTPVRVAPSSPAPQATPPGNLSATAGAAPVASSEKKWEIDGPEGAPAPHIRANMISFRVSYQGRIQVAFFDQD
ncbi:MAG TPA: hypothetical protein VMV10_19810 [Pirellulales bacterium]|nr:hypothetical protein [Pirellulales bacterium]